MAALVTSPVSGTGDVCKRCGEHQADLRIRSETVCQQCFCRYISTKVVKRMGSYRTKGAGSIGPRKLLLPLSFGPSSASLLYILNQHLQAQYDRMKRVNYELVVVHVDQYLQVPDNKRSATLLENYKTRYPRHKYSITMLDEALHLDDIDWEGLNMPAACEATSEGTDIDRLQQLINSISSTTSRSDVVSTLLTRLLVDVAKRNDCESILFADSTTRLAERTLAETAKGRGFSLPWQVSDGRSPFGVDFYYPQRDILKKELVLFSSLSTSPFADLVVYERESSSSSGPSKSTTIDDLMVQYFASVEENYPSIVANVVRTSSKLNVPMMDDASCSLCGLPVTEGTDGIHGWGGDQNSESRPVREDGDGSVLCYGCARSINS